MDKPKILIVDDDPYLRRALKLRLAGQPLRHGRTPRMDLLPSPWRRRSSPNIIILDLGLPAGDGYVVLEGLHNQDSLASNSVIVLTAGCKVQ